MGREGPGAYLDGIGGGSGGRDRASCDRGVRYLEKKKKKVSKEVKKRSEKKETEKKGHVWRKAEVAWQLSCMLIFSFIFPSFFYLFYLSYSFLSVCSYSLDTINNERKERNGIPE